MADASTQSPIEFIRTRRSVLAANITEPGPSSEELDIIIDAGLRVPDHSRCGPWRLQIVGKEGQHKLGGFMRSCSPRKTMKPPKNRSTLATPARRRRRALSSLLVIPTKKNPQSSLIEQQMSVGALCQNLSMVLMPLGMLVSG